MIRATIALAALACASATTELNGANFDGESQCSLGSEALLCDLLHGGYRWLASYYASHLRSLSFCRACLLIVFSKVPRSPQ